MQKELRTVFNDLNNPQLAEARAKNPDVNPAEVYFGTGAKPEDFGYGGSQVAREYMAEAIRAAMTNPNYMKTVTPKTYETIADFFSAHPLWSKHIQFNSLAGLGLLPLLYGGQPQADPVARPSGTLPTTSNATPRQR